jgi:vacuole morphology and inheritance protein 14
MDSATPSSTSTFSDRPNRLKARDDGTSIRWTDLFEKFRATQERARRLSGRVSAVTVDRDDQRALATSSPPPVPEKEAIGAGRAVDRGGVPGVLPAGSTPRPGSGLSGQVVPRTAPVVAREKGRSGLGLGRFAGGGRKGKK